MRLSERKLNQIRDVTIEIDILVNAFASCMIRMGNTHVICSANIEQQVPRFLKGKNRGWVTAEYGMLPNSTSERMTRESNQSKISGRTMEIQRLISRSLRASIDLKALGERQVIVDCDVINADGGTRTASITGGYVALHLAMRKLVDQKIIKSNPLKMQIAAISCGIRDDEILLDLDYSEDSTADVDANFIFASNGSIVEIQACAEQNTFSSSQLSDMMILAQKGAEQLFTAQNKVLLST
jgi:ribonuclease PH